MQQTSVPPDISTAASFEAINSEAVDDMSIGQLALAKAFFGEKLSERLADQHSSDEFATFCKAAGEDWSGHRTKFEHANHQEQTSPKPAPVPPENPADTIQAVALMLIQHERSAEADMANMVRKLDAALGDQATYLGVPEGIQGFIDVKDFLRQTAKMSHRKANKVIDRSKYITFSTARDLKPEGAAPKLPKIAEAFAQGRIPSENLDRIMQFDDDLNTYSHKVGKTPEYKDEVLQAFEPTLVEAAETATPEEITQAKHRWLEKIAHHIDADGPPPSTTLKKQPDNALRIRSHRDGSSTVSMHIEPVWAAFVKEFLNTNLNFKGKTPFLPEDIENLYRATAQARATQEEEDSETDETPGQDSFSSEPPTVEDFPQHPDEIAAEDADGNTYTSKEINILDRLSQAERAGAILLGALYSVMSMSPDEATAKTAHGAPAKLVIVQDIQTAYATLGLPALPEAVRRPDGPAGIMPTVIKCPDPSDNNSDDSVDADFTGHVNTVAWTPYQSEAVNVGPIHPANAETALCDVELVGQIWNGQDIVLNEYRSKRIFTTAQRKAIFARDKGCQAPGCSVQATYCQCHHRKEWSNDGMTNENNSVTLCSRHHSDVHNGKWTIRRLDGLTYFQPAPWVDPYQPLLRNLYWNT